MQKLHNFIIVILMVSSCTSYPEDIEEVLRQAGDNRHELEKVLKHYSKNPADSLKLRAAEFLIANMPDKYSAYYDAPWNDVATVMQRWTSSSDKQMVLDTYRLGEPVIKEDVKHITAEYLINNIELAFKVWQEMPWGKDIPFNVFCEEILPYRVDTEPLENWREKVMASFADLYRSFRDDTAITTVMACSKVNDILPRFRIDKDFPPMSFTQLMSSTRGVCDRMADFAIFVMRGLGIPVTFDFTPKWPFGVQGTAWNSVRDNRSGKHISFMGAQTNPGTGYPASSLLRIYRKTFGKQHDVLLDANDIPPLLHNFDHIMDVTAEYGHNTLIWFPIPKGHSSEKGQIFLATYDDMQWQPIALGTVTDYNLDFLSIISGLYLPVYYHNGKITPIGYPFKFGMGYHYSFCQFFQPASSCTSSLTSIAPMNYTWLHDMEDGKFEVANKSDFSDARTIHTIKTIGLGYQTVSVSHNSTFQYIRYLSPEKKRCNISILEFYDDNNEKLQGTVIGTPGTDAQNAVEKAFDGDVDTFFESASEHSWIGLDLEEPRRIAKIRFMPRTNGNGIYEGHVYELLYWNGDAWQSLGRKTADSHILQYNIPERALFVLKNLTKNRKHNSPFYMEYKTQQWFQ